MLPGTRKFWPLCLREVLLPIIPGVRVSGAYTVNSHADPELTPPQRHMETSHPAPAPADPASPMLIVSQTLQALGLVVHQTEENVWLLICPDPVCRQTLDPHTLKRHFHSKHPGTPIACLTNDTGELICQAYPGIGVKPAPPTIRINQIPHLEVVHDYLPCPNCRHCFQDRSSFKRHPCQTPIPTTPCTAQRYGPNTKHPWFEVVPASTPSPPADLKPYDVYLAQTSAVPPTESLPSSRLHEERTLNRFLADERWTAALSNTTLSHRELMNLCVIPPRDVLAQALQYHLYRFLLDTQRAMTYSYVRRLVGLRPETQHRITIQRHHHDVSDPTLKRYARVVVGAILLIHNTPSSSHPFSVSPETRSLVHELILSVQLDSTLDHQMPETTHSDDLHIDEDGELVSDSGPDWPPDEDESPASPASIRQRLVTLLHHFFTDTPPNAEDAATRSPLKQYLILASLSPDGSWIPASIITQKIAAILFVGRCTFAHLIQQYTKDHSVTHHQ